jgi:ribosome-binding protein aMBF1 (putative translation factor)
VTARPNCGRTVEVVSARSAGLEGKALTMYPTSRTTYDTPGANRVGDRHPGPQRYLAPHLAEAIRTGKEATGLSWRQFAEVVGRSSSHLNNISLGKRVPSVETAELLIDALDLNGDIADELRAAATPMWFERDRRSW